MIKNLLLLLLLSGSCFAEFTVKLEVVGKNLDKEWTDLITSYVSRELRGLNDVIVTEHPKAAFKLRIAALPVGIGDKELGITLSATCLIHTSILTAGFDRACIEKLESSAFPYTFLDGFLLLTNRPGLKEACESIVASFDSNYLLPLRKVEKKGDSEQK